MSKHKDQLGILITIPGEVQQAIENRALMEFPAKDEALMRAAFIVGAVYGYVEREFIASASYHGAAAELGLLYGARLRSVYDERCIEALWCPPDYLENPSELVLQIISGQLSHNVRHQVVAQRRALPSGRALEAVS